MKIVWHPGSCHCGAITFEVEAPEAVRCETCNCSICAKSDYLHLIVPKSRFRLLQGKHLLKAYTFHTGTAKHLFCSICGVKSFYIPRSNPDGYDVNVRCLNPPPKILEVRSFDGQHWERHGATLAHLSAER